MDVTRLPMRTYRALKVFDNKEGREYWVLEWDDGKFQFENRFFTQAREMQPPHGKWRAELKTSLYGKGKRFTVLEGCDMSRTEKS